MNTNICTSLEQSKKLIELRLNTDIADMCYFPLQEINNDIHYNLFAHKEDVGIPAWSLSVLLELLPEYIEYKDISYHLYFNKVKTGWTIEYSNHGYSIIWKIRDNLLDVVFETICWLLKEKEI